MKMAGFWVVPPRSLVYITDVSEVLLPPLLGLWIIASACETTLNLTPVYTALEPRRQQFVRYALLVGRAVEWRHLVGGTEDRQGDWVAGFGALRIPRFREAFCEPKT
jgi:hypothetical protein